MNKYPPVIAKSTALRLAKAVDNEVVDPLYVLSKDAGQQLAQGADNGVLLKGMVPKAAYPAAGDLCDWTIPTPTKTAVTVSKTFSDQLSISGLRTETVQLPVATLTTAGFMSGTDKEAIENLRSDVDALQGKGARLDAHYFTFDVFSDDPTERAAQEAEITSYAVTEWGSASLPDNLSVRNTNGGHLFRYNLETPPEDSYWVDDGADTTGIATTTSAGLVRAGDGGAGTVSVDADGDMSVAGWSGVELVSRRRSTFQTTPDNSSYPTEKLVYDQLAVKENLANKTTTLSGSSTTTQYPSAKTVWDALSAKENTANKVTAALSSSSTDAQYPSALRVYTELTAKENVGNKVTALSGSSTTTQYPSAKTVYDALALKEVVANKTTSLSSSSTNAQYPSAKTVYDALALKADSSSITDYEVSSNKVTALSSSSTTTQYPSAKTVYDALASKANTVLLSNYELLSNKATSISSSSTTMQYPHARAVYDAIEAAKKAYAGTVSFTKSDEVVYATVPVGVTKMYVETRWADVTSTMTLRIAAAATPTTTTNITTSTSGTTVTSFAGTAVAFSVSGMDSTAKKAVIGVRMF